MMKANDKIGEGLRLSRERFVEMIWKFVSERERLGGMRRALSSVERL